MTETAPRRSRAACRAPWLWLGGVLLLTALAYQPSLEAGLTNWDDVEYVTANPTLRELSWAGARQLFTSYYKGNYHPLTMLSLAVDYRLGGEGPRVHHAVNLLLHLANTALVALCVRGLGQPISVALGVAVLFGVHPMHVESVAWVSERKDVLHALFYLGALLAYLRWATAPGTAHAGSWLLALVLFLLALLSKATAVALAPTLVIVDHLLGRRAFAPRTLLEKAPFFLLALPFGLIAIDAQAAVGQGVDASSWSPFERLLLASHGLVRYLALLLFPHRLSAFYPYPERVDGALPWGYALSPVAVLGLLALLVGSWRRRPLVAFSLAFFLLNIALVLQLLPVGGAIMADRYSYLPSIGLFLAIATGAVRLAQRGRRAGVAVALACALYLGGLALATHQRCRVWHDSLSLWNDTLAKYPGIPTAHLNRALARFEQGDLAGADADLGEAIRLAPDGSGERAKAHAHRGVIRYQAGRVEAALADLDRAVALAPGAEIHANRGAVRLAAGNLPGALADLDRALALEPAQPLARANRGLARLALGRQQAAIEDFSAALALAPGYLPARVGRGEAHLALGDLARALADFDDSLALAPEHAPALLGRGRAAIALGRRPAGCRDLRRAAALGVAEAETEHTRSCATP